MFLKSYSGQLIILLILKLNLLNGAIIERAISNSKNDVSFNLETVTNITNFQAENPNLLINEISLERDVGGQLVYTLGARFPGDRVVAQASKNQSWRVPQNVLITLTYPSQGVGAQITFVHILVTQSSNIGRAYVIRGGLHQRFITIGVEANNTMFANYIATFYGI